MDYQLVIRISFTAIDDMDARLKARDLVSNSDICFEGDLPDYKLQRVYKGKPPEGVSM
jgi:hypothetical protein